MNALLEKIKSIIDVRKNTSNNEVLLLNGATTADNINERFELFRHAHLVLEGAEENLLTSPPSPSFINNKLSEKDIVGNYAVKGHNPGHSESPYFGHLTLNSIGGKLKAKWEIGFSRDIQLGEGFLFGNKVVLHFYYSEDDGEYAGMVIYEVSEDANLKGYWIEEGVFEPGFEHCELKNRIV